MPEKIHASFAPMSEKSGYWTTEPAFTSELYREYTRSDLVPRWEAVRKLIDAVQALPVEEWIERDQHNEPELVGYVIQCQGEWDAVLQTIRDLPIPPVSDKPSCGMAVCKCGFPHNHCTCER